MNDDECHRGGGTQGRRGDNERSVSHRLAHLLFLPFLVLFVFYCQVGRCLAAKRTGRPHSKRKTCAAHQSAVSGDLELTRQLPLHGFATFLRRKIALIVRIDLPESYFVTESRTISNFPEENCTIELRVCRCSRWEDEESRAVLPTQLHSSRPTIRQPTLKQTSKSAESLAAQAETEFLPHALWEIEILAERFVHLCVCFLY